eukprot:Phypoly_transcript_18675.p1 GENE.Phypoly_transcript_18675~~Phypoly_transcript_18675.p1  ORF type:complete len:206 (+),score=5.84 Phypoly_transcript_18675:85-702(+)
MELFTRRHTAHQTFALKLDENPYYPFTKIGANKFFFMVRYTRFFMSIAVFVISLLIVILLAAFKLAFQFYFILCVVTLIYSGAVAFTYRGVRQYTLDGDTQLYTFKIRQQSPNVGPYHNVYIRLRKTMDSGTAMFYLIFNGYQMEKIVLTGTSHNMTALRQLGQQLASNLNINYFDEPNVSPHHVLRHDRPAESKMKRVKILADV